MESYMVLGFVGILREALKIFSKNGKLMATITFLNLFICSFFYLSNTFSTKSLISDWIMKSSLLLTTDPSSPEYANLLIGIKEDIKTFIGLELIFLLAKFIVSLLSQTATILASAITHGGKDISIKGLLLKTVRSWKRPFVTLLYTNLFGFGYIFIILAIMIPLGLFVNSPVASGALYIVILILAMIVYAYLAVVWSLGVVVSVLEERSGIDALGKAAELVKGMRLKGFLLNIVVMILSIVGSWGMGMISVKQSAVISVIIGMIIINSMCLITVFWLMVYTVLYYQCKKNHGEEVELEFNELRGSTEYSKLPTALLINENIP